MPVSAGADFNPNCCAAKKEEIPAEIWYNEITTKQNTNSEEFLMNIIAQEAKKRQAVVKLANRKGKSYAS